jgi:hypothetical protein
VTADLDAVHFQHVGEPGVVLDSNLQKEDRLIVGDVVVLASLPLLAGVLRRGVARAAPVSDDVGV